MSHLRILHLSSIEVCTGWESILSDAAGFLEELSLGDLSYATDYKVASAMPPLTALRTVHLSRRHSVEGINADLALEKLILGASQCTQLSIERYGKCCTSDLVTSAGGHLMKLSTEGTPKNLAKLAAKIAAKLEHLLLQGNVRVVDLPDSLIHISVRGLDYVVGWESLLRSPAILPRLRSMQWRTWQPSVSGRGWLRRMKDSLSRLEERGISVTNQYGHPITSGCIDRELDTIDPFSWRQDAPEP